MGKHFRKTVYLENLGCAKNQVDGEALVSRLLDTGWHLAASPEDADFIIVNTCGFIEAAKRESLDTVLGFHERYPEKRVILAGCLAQRYGKVLFDDLPEAAAVFGNRDLARIDELLRSLSRKERSLLLPETDGRLPERRINLAPPGSVYVKIAEGCDNRCSYCAIPLIRGGLKSRSPDDVVSEVRAFLAAGVKEIDLVAQDLGLYGRDFADRPVLTDLLGRLSELPGKFWLRLLYIHPEHFPKELPSICRRDPRVLPYFDIPFQHASPRVLNAMGRSWTMERNLELLAGIRSELPEAVIRSTFLVGFPGEGEEDFEKLLEFQERAGFDWLGAFTYSPEEDTPAELLHRKRAFKVTKKTAAERKRLVEERQTPITERNLDRFVGKELEVLVEEHVAGEDLSIGRAYLNAPEVDGLVVLHGTGIAPGKTGFAKIIRRNGFDLEAAPIP